MKKWILKAIIQKVISILPFSFYINYFFQRYITKAVVLSDDFFTIMLEHHKEATYYITKHGGKLKGSSILELGTGWHPIMSVAFFLVGADEIITIDLRKLIRINNVKTLLKKFIQYHDEGKLANYLPDLLPERIQSLKAIYHKADVQSIDELLLLFNTKQIIQDAAKLNCTENHFDICFSVNVLEHVSELDVKPILSNFTSVNKNGGFQYHAIGCYDHFVHIDKTISKFNYLKYSKGRWKRIDNDIQPQNRLRISYFKDLFLSLNLNIAEEVYWKAEPNELAKINVHEDFKDIYDLDIPYGTFILQK